MYINKMKRIFTLLIIVITTLIAGQAKAQIKSYVGFFGGISIPQGDFAKADYYNNQAGFAKKGLNYGIDGTYYVYKNLGIGGTISYQDNGELNQANADSLAAGYTNSFGADGATVTAHNRYQTVNVLIGPQYSFPFGNFIVDIRASAGFKKVFATPETSILLSGVTDQTATFYQRSASSIVFAYGGNLALRYKLSDGIFLTLRGAYVATSGPTITNQDRTTDIGRLVTKQPMSDFQTTLGLNFGF
jgi:hypothetical protein